MKIGDEVHIKATIFNQSFYSGTRILKCRVSGIYNNFALLDAGKYKVCAYMQDIKKGRSILI